jgi:hypothetical protein
MNEETPKSCHMGVGCENPEEKRMHSGNNRNDRTSNFVLLIVFILGRELLHGKQ